MFYRDTWAQVHLDDISQNIQTVRAHSGKAFIAVIKANGYGCGDDMLAKTALEAGAVYLAVSSLDEALSLRYKGVNGDILVLEYISPSGFAVAREHRIALTASSTGWLEQATREDLRGLKIHLKLDTGMNRIGFDTVDEIRTAIDRLEKCGAQPEGLYTHLACSDIADNQMSLEQLERFHGAINALHYPFRWIHCANTDASFHLPDAVSNAVRCGIAMLGTASYDVPLKPALSLFSRLVHVKKVPKGQRIGYGATYETTEDEWIGTIPIGYADGWVRGHQGRMCLVDDTPCPFVGRICMDQAMIRLPKAYPLGTVVELIGPGMPITRVAAELGTIPYEIMTLLSDRIAKVYIKDGKESAVVNPRLDNLMR